LVANIGRSFLLTYLAARQGLDELHHWHDPLGMAVLLTVFSGLLLAALGLRGGRSSKFKVQSSKLSNSPPLLDRGEGQSEISQKPDSAHSNHEPTVASPSPPWKGGEGRGEVGFPGFSGQVHGEVSVSVSRPPESA